MKGGQSRGVSTRERHRARGFLVVSSEDKAGTVTGTVLRDLDSTSLTQDRNSRTGKEGTLGGRLCKGQSASTLNDQLEVGV